MASTRLAYPLTTPWGAQVAELASLFQQTSLLATRIKMAMDKMCTNGAGPWTEVETELNLVAGVGAPLYGLVANLQATLQGFQGIGNIDMGS